MTSPADRLRDLGIELPTPGKPLASYVGYRIIGDMVTISGQLPLVDGALSQTGLLGDGVTVEQGQAAARACAINIVAQINVATGGDLSRVKACVRLGGFVASTPSFTDHHKVINGASDFMVEVFGNEVGSHARAAVGVAQLPMGASVEVDALFQIAP